MKAYRIGSGAHAVFDGRGASLYPGRWNEAGQRVIYCGASFAICMLERLCYTALGRLPVGDMYVEIHVPDALIEILDESLHSGWSDKDYTVARDVGSRWFAERRSVGLLVPSAVSVVDRNIILNQDHPDFANVKATPEMRVSWDKRLFVR